MRILIVRHGDPDYEKDSLTKKGWKEAKLLAERLAKLDVKAFYVSPLGRAKDTASCTLEKMGRTAEECSWLQEFPPMVLRPDNPIKSNVAWDWLPEDWMKREAFFHKDLWYLEKEMKEAGVKDAYCHVIDKFDQLLAEYGYQRDGDYYKVCQANRDTIVFFCHFGLECVLLSHLMNVSPMILWHHMCAAPTSVTTIYTEERRKGIASFRVNSFGDISHLYVGNEEPAFAARFCEIYDCMEERHD